MKKKLVLITTFAALGLVAVGCGNGNKSTTESTDTEVSSSVSEESSSSEEKMDTKKLEYTVVYRSEKDGKNKTVIAAGFGLKVKTSSTLVSVLDTEGSYVTQQSVEDEEEIDLEKLGKDDKELVVRLNGSVIAMGENLVVSTGSTLVSVKEEDGSYLAQKSIERTDIVTVEIDGEETEKTSESSADSSSASSKKTDSKTSSSTSKSSSASKDVLELFDGDYVGGDSYLPVGRYDLEFIGSGYNSISDDDDFWENNNGGDEKFHGVNIQDGMKYSIQGDIRLKKTKPLEAVDGTYSLFDGIYIGGTDLPVGTYDLSFTGSGYNSISDDGDFWENNNGGDERFHGVVIAEGEEYEIQGELELTLLQ